MLKLGVEMGCEITKIHNIYVFEQAPFCYNYVQDLTERRRVASENHDNVGKQLCKNLINQLYGKHIEVGLHRIKVAIAMNEREENRITRKYMAGLLLNWDCYGDDMTVFRIANPRKKINKCVFVGAAILDISKSIIYDMYYRVLKPNFAQVNLMGQDTDSMIVKLRAKDNTTVNNTILDLWSYFDFSEIDRNSPFYSAMKEYYNKNKNNIEFGRFTSFDDKNDRTSFVHYNEKIPGPVFKDEHKGWPITTFVGLRPKLYCILDQHNVIHQASKGVQKSGSFGDDGDIFDVTRIDRYLYSLFPRANAPKDPKKPKMNSDAEQYATFRHFVNRKFGIHTKCERKAMISCTDDKRYVLNNNTETLAWGHHDIPAEYNERFMKKNGIQK